MIVSCWYELVFSFQVNILLHYIAWLSSEWQQVWYISGVDWKLGQYSGLSQWLTNSMYTMCSKLSCICHLFEHFCLWLQEDIYGKVESFIFIFVILLFVLYLKWKKVGITDKLVLVWLFLKTSELFCFIFLHWNCCFPLFPSCNLWYIYLSSMMILHWKVFAPF